MAIGIAEEAEHGEKTHLVAPAEEITLLRPRKGWQPVRLAELWRYRELLLFLAWRDVKVRYKQTALGIGWAVLQPLFMMILSSVIFGGLARISSGDVPYPLFALCGLLPWQLFAYALSQASNSVVAEQNLITKVYFPRIIVPLSSVLSGLVDFVIAFVLLLGMMAVLRDDGLRRDFAGMANSRRPVARLLALARPRWRSACGCRR